MNKITVILGILSGLIWRTHAQCGSFSFASYYGDSMVLQRDVGAVIWGYATSAGLQVDVDLDGVVYSTTSIDGPAGSPTWRVTMDPQTGPGPSVIMATSESCTMQLNDVLFGDVWLCSGQSNMAHRFDNIDDPDADLIDAINYPNVRGFRTGQVFSDTPQYDLTSVEMGWTVPDSSNMASFSAVCWFFGRNLNIELGVPIGLIQTSWGGTRIEAWSSPDALAVCFPGGAPPENDQNAASALWNAMIHPYLPLPIYGAIWYQGESNAGNYQDYGCAIQQMVGDWRQKFYDESGQTMDPQFPFGQVQLAPNAAGDVDTGFPDVRWAQTHEDGYTPNADLVDIFTAVAMDLPDYDSPEGSIHPRYKRQISERLSYGAFQVAYGIGTAGPFLGPMPTSATVSTSVEVTYDDGNANIEIRTNGNFDLCCADVATNRCPTDGTWTATTITSNTASTVTLGNPCANFVTGLRYGWRVSPCDLELCAVYGVENELPAPPYTMDI